MVLAHEILKHIQHFVEFIINMMVIVFISLRRSVFVMNLCTDLIFSEFHDLAVNLIRIRHHLREKYKITNYFQFEAKNGASDNSQNKYLSKTNRARCSSDAAASILVVQQKKRKNKRTVENKVTEENIFRAFKQTNEKQNSHTKMNCCKRILQLSSTSSLNR